MPTVGDAAAQRSALDRVRDPNLEDDPVDVLVREGLWVDEGLEDEESAADALVARVEELDDTGDDEDVKEFSSVVGDFVFV